MNRDRRSPRCCWQFLVAWSCVLVYPGKVIAHPGDALKSPVYSETQISSFGARDVAVECQLPKSLPHKVESVGFYTDSKASVIDQALYQRFLESRKVITDEEEYLATQNSNYVLANKAAKISIGQCLRSHLLRIAEDDVFTGSDDIRGGGAVRLMSVTPILSYLLVREGSEIEVAGGEKIRAWIDRLMERLLWLEKNFKYENNIEDWTGAAFALGAVALNRSGLLDHALEIALRKSQMVDSDGLLPLERGRGQMAVEYSLSATQALSIIAVVGEANGRDVLSEKNGSGLIRLMRRMVLTINDPSSFLKFTDSQEAIASEHFDRQNMGWLEIYYRKTKDRDALRAICRNKPLFSWRTGGDWFVFFGSPDQCSKPQ